MSCATWTFRRRWRWRPSDWRFVWPKPLPRPGTTQSASVRFWVGTKAESGWSNRCKRNHVERAASSRTNLNVGTAWRSPTNLGLGSLGCAPHIARMFPEPLLRIDLPGIEKVKSGKVREIFDLGDSLLLVATDRISAFDCIMPNGIPHKGEVLAQISHFWFDQMSGIVPNHRLNRADDPLPPQLLAHSKILARR